LLLLGDEGQPAAMRVGVLLHVDGAYRVWGPEDGGVQVYHCVPDVTAVDAPGLPVSINHAGFEVRQVTDVLVGPDGVCEDEAPECVRGCDEVELIRVDLYLDRDTGQTLLIRQRRELDALAEPPPSFSLAPRVEAGKWWLSDCAGIAFQLGTDEGQDHPVDRGSRQ
jgi:hypothetical protein